MTFTNNKLLDFGTTHIKSYLDSIPPGLLDEYD